ncbi:MAG: PEP-CTERM sorting domain-containing protein [Rhizobacter sp.]|nr:PEP-CTERM sorting domain-containing protein [Rhizobacter sp.]
MPRLLLPGVIKPNVLERRDAALLAWLALRGPRPRTPREPAVARPLGAQHPQISGGLHSRRLTAVPEPATVALLVAGLCTVTSRSTRRHARAWVSSALSTRSASRVNG